jgi:myo-inositol catabolism protein IolC
MNFELEQEYKKVSGFDVGKIHDTGCTYYSDDYVKWLESKIQTKYIQDEQNKTKN